MSGLASLVIGALTTKDHPTDLRTMTTKTQPNPIDGCPVCGKDLWDNRATKKNPKAPDYKCKDKNCDGCIWPLKAGETYAWPKDAAHSNEKRGYSAGAALPYENQETGAPPDVPSGSVHPRLDNLLTVYEVCFDKAHSLAKEKFGKDESHEATAAMAATMLIAAKDMGLVR